MTINEKDVKNFFDLKLPEVLKMENKEIEAFMDRFGTKQEWIEKRELLDCNETTNLELMKQRAYDVDFMSKLLVENVILYCGVCGDEEIFTNIKNEIEKMNNSTFPQALVNDLMN